MTTDAGEFRGKVALVTGAAQGIGRAVARSLAAAGAFVHGLDVREDGLSALVEELNRDGCRAAAHCVDVCDAAAVDQAVASIDRAHPIDLLANVAGILHVGPAVSLLPEVWERTFAVNAGGTFHVSRAVARRMIPRGRGVIVTVCSNAGRVPRMNMAAYAASKAAAAMFTRCLGLELAEHGIRCNIVSPGSTDTDMQRSLWHQADAVHRVLNGDPDHYRTGIPLKRIATVQNIADAVLFLLSDRAAQITMQDLVVDGGAILGN